MKSKFRFIITITFAFILCFSLSGCKEHNWQFEQSVENIEKIEIVILSDTESYYYTEIPSDVILSHIKIIKEINTSDYCEVIENIQSLSMKIYFGDPVPICGNGFKITYKNGDFDFITKWEPTHFYNKGEYYLINSSRWVIRKTECQELIEKWSA